jgi:hypothetical protein
MHTERPSSAAPVHLCQEVLMPKLKLDPEMLRVESFAPEAAAVPPRGTVDGHSYVTFNSPNQACSEPASQQCLETDHHLYTCGASCIEECHPTGGQPGCID